MKKFLLAALLSLAIMFTSVSASSLFSYQGFDMANNEEPAPWPYVKK